MVTISPAQISPHVKRLGIPLLSYVLNIGEDEVRNIINNGGDISVEQCNAIESLNNISDQVKLLRCKNQVIEKRDLQTFGQSLNSNGESVFKEIRDTINQESYIHQSYDDPLMGSFSKICENIFPIFLLPQFGQDIFSNLPSLYGTRIENDFQAALINDSIISSIFPDTSSDLNPSRVIYSSVGHGGSLQISQFSNLLLQKSYILMRLRNQLDLENLIAAGKNVLEMMRKAIQGESVTVPLVVCFGGIMIDDDIENNIDKGQIRKIHNGIIDVFPAETLPATNNDKHIGFIYQYEVDYKIKILPNHIDVSDEWPVKQFDHEIINNISENISLAFALFTNGVNISSVFQKSSSFFDPLSSGSSIGWKENNINLFNHPITLNSDDIKSFQEWFDIISNVSDNKISLAKRRLLLSLNERRNPEDGFIDAIIGLENLFGQKTEIAFTVASCVSKIIGNTLDERNEIFEKVKNLYNQRSRIVHANGKAVDNQEMSKYCKDSVEYLIQCLRWLYTEKPELICLDSSKRATQIILN